MSKRDALGIAVLLLAGLLVASCAGASSLEPIELVVLHTNDNWGETEPCG
jgi:hypothetical protein